MGAAAGALYADDIHTDVIRHLPHARAGSQNDRRDSSRPAEPVTTELRQDRADISRCHGMHYHRHFCGPLYAVFIVYTSESPRISGPAPARKAHSLAIRYRYDAGPYPCVAVGRILD